jgi:transcription initiation factor TFIIH subunit 4
MGNQFEILVQTNFQLVAYTQDPLHIRMVGTFCQLKAILPNALVCTLTRSSVMDALEDGITADVRTKLVLEIK